MRRRSRGRPPGINPERQAVLAQLADAGLSLEQMAKALAVSRQCVHKQLSKCPQIARRWQAHRSARRRLERQHHHAQQALRLRERAIQRAQRRSVSGVRLARFLRLALAHGCTVQAEPKHRPRINGAVLAFHVLRRRRPTRSTHQHPTEYYQLNLVHPEWLHVVCLPTGRYLFYPPDVARRPGSHYIPEWVGRTPQAWPEWLGRPEPGVAALTAQRRRSGADTNAPAWAA